MTDNKVYNMQNADLVRLVCLGAACWYPVPANWMRTLKFAIWERAQTSALRQHL